MSGIGGIVNFNKMPAPETCDAIASALKSRGADAVGNYFSWEICLFHIGGRLENGKQPVRAVADNKAYVLVFDGEIYNRDELRKELGRREQSDAALALHGYIKWGESCVERFNGVFALALWDGERLFLARDRLGLRPLFYSVGAFGIVFASNVKGVLAHPEVRPVITAEGAAEILLLGPGRTPGCGVFKGVFEIAPGSYGVCTPGHGIELTTYWKLKAAPFGESLPETLKTVRGLIIDAVKLQGGGAATLLSGGVDSSALAALSKSRQSFSVDYYGNDKFFTPNSFQPEDDGEYIAQMVSFLRLKHKRFVLGSDELADGLADAMDARGLPGMADVDSALLLFLRKVAEEAAVALSGEGADEIFGGYPWYQDEKRLWAAGFPWSQSVRYRAGFLSPRLRVNPEEYVKARYEWTVALADFLYDDEPLEKRVRQMFTLNLKWFLQTLASRIDTMAATAGITVRVPFLDYRLVEYLYNVPWAFKNHKDREKGLLREALKGLLPDAVLWRKKSPFPKTHNPGYLKRVEDMLRAVLGGSDAPIYDLVSRDALRGLLEPNERENWYGQLMSHPQTIAYFLQINEWMKKYSVSVEN